MNAKLLKHGLIFLLMLIVFTLSMYALITVIMWDVYYQDDEVELGLFMSSAIVVFEIMSAGFSLVGMILSFVFGAIQIFEIVEALKDK